MFKEQYRRDNERLKAGEDLLMEIKKKSEKKKRNTAIAIGSIAAAAVVIVGLCVTFIQDNTVSPDGAGLTAEAGTEAAGAAEEYIATFTSHGEIYDYFEETLFAGRYGYAADTAAGAVMEESAAAEGAAMDVPAAAEPMEESAAAEEAVETEQYSDSVSSTSSNGSKDYSETNVQVAGVDEADIVKTDGEYIYYIANQTLYITEADAGDMDIVSRTDLMIDDDDNDDIFYHYGAQEMFLAGDKLIVIQRGFKDIWIDDNMDTYAIPNDMTFAAIYDISDRSDPEREGTLGQTGYYVSSRMADGMVYIVTSQHVWDIYEQEPRTYLPYMYADGEETAIAASDVYAAEGSPYPSYTIVSSIDTAKAEKFDSSKALLGGAEDIYMTSEYLLVAAGYTDVDVSDIHKDETGRNVQITKSKSVTDLVLFSLDSGQIEKHSAGRVPGMILNQFSMDIYNDVIRVVTTADEWTETIYTDGVDTYEHESKTTNGLYTLDLDMELLGRVDELAKDEHVESVRFDGDIAYFVTFETVDPLFCADISDPENPKILDALKISGFSEYMHGYGEGRLLGIGYAADEETGITECVKMTMFNTEDKTDITEITTEKLENAYWTEVGYNHKSALIDYNKNIIAFPAEDMYFVYSYTDGGGFNAEKVIDTGGCGDGSTLRGVFIGDAMYILCSEWMISVSLDGYETIDRITFD